MHTGGLGVLSVAGEFGDGFRGAGVIGEGFVVGGAGDEGGGGRVVEGPRQAVGDAVDTVDGVVGEEQFIAAGQRDVVTEVGGGLADVRGLDREAGRDALVEGGQDAHAALEVQSGLSDEDLGDSRWRGCVRWSRCWTRQCD